MVSRSKLQLNKLYVLYTNCRRGSLDYGGVKSPLFKRIAVYTWSLLAINKYLSISCSDVEYEDSLCKGLGI